MLPDQVRWRLALRWGKRPSCRGNAPQSRNLLRTPFLGPHPLPSNRVIYLRQETFKMDDRCWTITERREIAPNKTKLVPQNLLKFLVAPIFLTSGSGSPITFKGHFCVPISPTEVSLLSGRAKQHFFTLASSVSVDRVAPIRGSTSQVGARRSPR